MALEDPKKAREWQIKRGMTPTDQRRRITKGRKKARPTKREQIGRRHVFRMRVTAEEWQAIRYMAGARGFPSASEYMRSLVAMDMNLDLSQRAR